MGKKRFKQILCLTLSILMLLSNIAYADTTAETIKCPDIVGNKYEAQLREWVDNGFITGDSEGKFRPEKTVTRAEFMALVNRSFGFTEAAEINFSDVSVKNWFYKDAAIAVKKGYMIGNNGMLTPLNPISRQEFAIVLARLTNSFAAADDKVLEGLADGKAIPEWSKAAVSAAVAKGYFEGFIDDSFKPTEKITKLEVAVGLDRALKSMYKAVYMKKGTYGPDSGMQILDGSAMIVSPEVTLKNTTINGDLILRESIGEGNVYLDNVVVKGTTIVKGGGANSIVIRNSSLGSVIVRREGNVVRIVATGSTTIGDVNLQSGATLHEEFLTGTGFGDVVIPDDILAGATIVFEGNFDDIQVDSNNANINVASGTIGSLTLAPTAAGTTVNLNQGTKVNTLNLNAAANITGQGSIQTANINAPGVTIQQQPQVVKVAPGVTATVNNKPTTGTSAPAAGGSTGGGGGGGGGGRDKSVAVTGITLDRTSLGLTVGGAAVKLTATVLPANASNKSVEWISSNTAVATVEDGVVTPVAAGTATITARTVDGGKTATCVVTVVAATDGFVMFDWDRYAHSHIVGITVEDADMNKDPLAAESLKVHVKSSTESFDLELTESEMTEDGLKPAPDSGVFMALLDLTAPGGEDEVFTTLEAAVGDNIFVEYMDEIAADGNKNVLRSDSAVIIPQTTATISFDYDRYNIGNWITVTVTDPDSDVTDNRDTARVKITSEKDKAGFDLILDETGSNTGVFKADFCTGEETNSEERTIGVNTAGDTITAEYRDFGSANEYISDTVAVEQYIHIDVFAVSELYGFEFESKLIDTEYQYLYGKLYNDAGELESQNVLVFELNKDMERYRTVYDGKLNIAGYAIELFKDQACSDYLLTGTLFVSPMPHITSGNFGGTVYTDTIKIEGYISNYIASEDNSLQIIVNDGELAQIPIADDGSFAADVKLVLGVNNVKLHFDFNYEGMTSGSYRTGRDIVYTDIKAPMIDEVKPVEGPVELTHDETFKLTVDAKDDGELSELEIDHNMENQLPEFSVYADEVNPYGDSRAAFEAAGVEVTYDADEQKWEIDFGAEVTDLIVNNGGITFYIVIKDTAGNQFGTMYGTTPENTFEYTVTRVAAVNNKAELEAALADENIAKIIVNGNIEGNFTIDRAVTLCGEGVLSNDTTVGAPILSITSEGVVIDGLTFDAEVGVPFNTQTIGINVLSSNVTVKNCTVNVTGNKSAIGLQSGMTINNVVIDKNTINGGDELGCAAIALNANGAGIKVTNNTVHKGAIGSGPLSKATAQNITIKGNTITESKTEGIFLIVNEASLEEATAIAAQLNSDNSVTNPGTTNVLIIYSGGNLYLPKLTKAVKDEAELKAALSDTQIGTIKLSNDINLAETLLINREVVIDGAGYSVSHAINITGDNVIIKNLNGTVVNRNMHKLSGVGSATAFFVNARNVVLDNVTVEDDDKNLPSIAVIGWKGSEFTVMNSSFEGLTTGIFAHLGYTQSEFQNKLTAINNRFANVLAGIGGTQKTDLIATGNTFATIKENGEGIGLGVGAVILGSTGDSDVAYLESVNLFEYASGKKVKDYRSISVPTDGNLQVEINKADENATILLDAGIYQLTGPLTINKAITLKGVGEGSTIIITPNNACAVISANNVTFEGIGFEGRWGIQVKEGIAGTIIKDCRITLDNEPQRGEGALRFQGGNGEIKVSNTIMNGTLWIFGTEADQDLSGIIGNTIEDAMFTGIGYHANNDVASIKDSKTAYDLYAAQTQVTVDGNLPQRLVAIEDSAWNLKDVLVYNVDGITHALDKSIENATIRLAEGTYGLTEQLNITKPVSIIGEGNVILIAAKKPWRTENGYKHLLAIYAGTKDVPVRINNIKVDANNVSHAVNAYYNAYGVLTNVTIENGLGAGLTVNGSTIEANNLNTSNNAWGAVNVDPGSGVNTPSVFVFNSGDLAEEKQIWSDGKNVSANATVSVTVPEGYEKYVLGESKVTIWTNRDIDYTAKIEKDETDILYKTIQAAINEVSKAEVSEKTTFTIQLSGKEIEESFTVNKISDDISYVIQGSDSETRLRGTITINSNSRYYDSTLVIENIDFVDPNAEETNDFISFGTLGGQNPTRYASNVTIENCTFTGTDQKDVAVRLGAGSGVKNITIMDSEVVNCHSLLQGSSTGITVKGCKITGTKSGINLQQATDILIEGCDFSTAEGYAIRAGQSSGTPTDTNLMIKDSILSSSAVCTDENLDDPDTALVLRGDAPKNIIITGCTLSNTNDGSYLVTYSDRTYANQFVFYVDNNIWGGGGYNPEYFANLEAAGLITPEYEEVLASVQEADYTSVSWSKYQKVVEANRVIVSYTEDEIEEAISNIRDAQADLVEIIDRGFKEAKANLPGDSDDEAVGVEYEVSYESGNLCFYVRAIGEPVSDTAELAYLVINVADKHSVIGDTDTNFTRGAHIVSGVGEPAAVAGGDFVELSDAGNGWYMLSVPSTDFDDEAGVIVTAGTRKPARYVENTLFEGTSLKWTYDNFIKFENPEPGKFSDLTAYIAALAAVQEEDYTAESWEEYQLVVAENKVTAFDPQTKVDAAVQAIIEAQQYLVELPAGSFIKGAYWGEPGAVYYYVEFEFRSGIKVGDLSSIAVSAYYEDTLLATNTLIDEKFDTYKESTKLGTSFSNDEAYTSRSWICEEFDGTKPDKIVVTYIKSGKTYEFETSDITWINEGYSEDLNMDFFSEPQDNTVIDAVYGE